MVSQLKSSEIDIIQLRDKYSPKSEVLNQARRIKKILSGTNKLFIINDFLDIAKIVDADGVHLGQKDMPLKVARRILGKDKIIGISCHSRTQAATAEKQGADYIGIGPVFSTPTKPEYRPIGIKCAKSIGANSRIPYFFIGGINRRTIQEFKPFKIGAVAVARAVLKATNPTKIIAELRNKLR